MDNHSRYLIESYREQGQGWRHDDIILHGLTAIILPISFTAFGIHYAYDCMPPIVPLLGGLALMMFWFALCRSIYIRIRIKFELMSAIEDHLEIPGHVNFRAITREVFTRKLGQQRLYERVFKFYLILDMFAISLVLWPSAAKGIKAKIDSLPDMWLAVIVIIIGLIILGLARWIVQKSIRPIPENSETLQDIISKLAQKKTDKQ